MCQDEADRNREFAREAVMRAITTGNRTGIETCVGTIFVYNLAVGVVIVSERRGLPPRNGKKNFFALSRISYEGGYLTTLVTASTHDEVAAEIVAKWMME